jgi:hypothetical protein
MTERHPPLLHPHPEHVAGCDPLEGPPLKVGAGYTVEGTIEWYGLISSGEPEGN